MTENELRQAVCAAAKRWLGRKEADGSHREILDCYNSIRPMPRGYRLRDTDPWCAGFVSAVGKVCGLTDTLLPECGCERMIELYRRAGRWVEDDDCLPSPGDLIFYDWQDSGLGDNRGTADHVGLVLEVSDGMLTVIEGNLKNAVGLRKIALDARFIRGFALPDYAAKAGEGGGECQLAFSDHCGICASASSDAGGAEPQIPKGGGECRVLLPLLRRGDRGVAVRSAQTLLILRGFGCGGSTAGGAERPDGDFGPATEAAVLAFQRRLRLEADGVIGPESWSALLTR